MTSETDKYKNKIAVLKTSMGDIELAFFPEDAPKAVENFIRLAESGYYNGVTFHRVVKDFVIQGGDPTGTGAGGESVFGPTFEDELDPSTPSYQRGYKKGVLAMANSGPNTNGSQFFILLKDNPLPHLYTIFGEVLSGQDVVDKIGLVEVGLGDKPLVDVVIEQVIIQ
ncbi:MAG: peptidylprolyl isomerase [Candidatus Doudnabacteria bacterium RIFCSPHIGHO2_01_FULL_43_23]|uniref:Peptidyl-prolyl cis-trans isomerase n=1 Tax=Candidatus Doudnabacteria bacterium RIFCSPHIGHO2_01_FULL_43_23 TaxID=1817822 RepID=A0A1F5NVD8_9BACT|nr:MAG: peptidylprolyl isomerase [Candidatus Doudnabacteria bacterium RIFCSPHIGHO2_01_FULL_43_23]